MADTGPRTLFHFSFAVSDLERARRFYGEVLQCPEGRRLPGRADFNYRAVLAAKERAQLLPQLETIAAGKAASAAGITAPNADNSGASSNGQLTHSTR